MAKNKWATVFVCWMTLQILTACCNDSDSNQPAAPKFFSAKVVSMISNDYNTIKTQGWGNLVVPRSAYSSVPSLKMSADAKTVADRLHEAGFKVHLVGGTVRDYAMDVTPADFDFVTDATYEQCDSLFKPNFVLHQAGGNYYGGVQMPGEFIDVARYNTIPEEFFGKVKLPEDTKPSLLSDSFQRDLPFNALFYDPYTEEIIDYHGGLYSLYTRTVTPMVNPEVELPTNPRVIIRAIRFAAKFDFKMDDELDRVLKEKGMEYLKAFPKNNFNSNVSKMFKEGYAQRCAVFLDKYDLWTFVIPSLAKVTYPKDYKDYLNKLMVKFDEEINWKAFQGWEDAWFVFASLLQPRYKDLCESMTQEEAFAKVMEEQSANADLSDADKQGILDALKKLK